MSNEQPPHQLVETHGESIVVALMQKDIENIVSMLKELKDYFLKVKEEQEKKFVTKDELKAALESYKPVKTIVYTVSTAVALAVVAALLATIIKS